MVSQRGTLAQLTNRLSKTDLNIVNVNIDEHDGYTNIMFFTLGVNDRVHLARAIKSIRTLPFVNKIVRI